MNERSVGTGLLLLWLLAGMFGAQEPVTHTAVVQHERTYGDDGVQFFSVGGVLVSADAELAVAKFLREAHGKKVRVTFEVVELEALKR